MNKKVKAISKATLKQNREMKKVMSAVAEEVKHCEDWYPTEYKTALGFAQDLVKAIRKRKPKYTREELSSYTDLEEQCQFVRNELTNIIGYINTGIPEELGTLPDYIRNLRDECVPSDEDIDAHNV